MIILHVASEVSPFSQSGGLAQVAAALPAALAMEGHELFVLSPLYRSTRARIEREGRSLRTLCTALRIDLGSQVHECGLSILDGDAGAPHHLFVDAPYFFDRDGLYGDKHGEYGDNAQRFALLSLAAIEAVRDGHVPKPDVVHCHDWQTGLLPLLLDTRAPELRRGLRTVFTIHNLAYQGVFPKALMDELELPWSSFTLQGLEFYDQVNSLKAGVSFSDVTTTVSERYADEILEPAFGCNLHDFLRYDCPRLVGIRNGIDVDEWDPSKDQAIAATFDSDDLQGKETCRAALLEEYGLSIGDGELLLGLVSRLDDQKGLDLLADLVPELSGLGARLIVLGSGDPELEARFQWLAECFSEHLSVFIGFDAGRAHRVFSGVDAFVMPSRFEPCGLGQMAAMRYGSVPIVHAVGGLRDTVHDPGDEAMAAGSGNGFRFEHASASGLYWALERATTMRRTNPSGWRELALRGMRSDWSWRGSAAKYIELYQGL